MFVLDLSGDVPTVVPDDRPESRGSSTIRMTHSGTMSPDVSIIVVSYNTLDLTGACLRSIKNGTPGLATETIVIDNASGDGSADMIESCFPEAQLIRNTENVGFAAANNQGLKLARGRYVLLLNPDTQVAEEAIAKTVEFADANPRAGVIGCRVLFPDGEQQSTLFRYRRLRHVFLNVFLPENLISRSRVFGRARYVGLDLDRVQDVEVVAGCFMLVRREAIEAVGAMDSDFFMYSEEAEWCYRMRKSGWKVLYFPGAEIMHLSGQSTKQERRRMVLAMDRGHLLFIQKTQGWLAAYIANVLMMLRDLPRVLLWKLLAVHPAWRGGGLGRSLMPATERFALHWAGLLRRDWRQREFEPKHSD